MNKFLVRNCLLALINSITLENWVLIPTVVFRPEKDPILSEAYRSQISVLTKILKVL